MGNACTEGIAGPSRPKGNITLKYFPIAGRAEPIRLALKLGQFDFYDQRIPGEEWESRHRKQMPYGQLPVLVVGEKKLAQTKAILRFIGKMSKYEGRLLYPKDPFLAAKVDEVMDAFDDLFILLAPTFRIKDKEQKEQARMELFKPGGQATNFIVIFERILSESSTGYVVPEAGLTIADLMYFCSLSFIRSGFFEGLKTDLFKGYPNIMKHKEMVAQIPVIKAYYQDVEKSNPVKVASYEVYLPGK